MIITALVFTQLLLAVVYNEYQVYLKWDLTWLYSSRTKWLDRCFSELWHEDNITLYDFKGLVKELNTFPSRRKVDEQNI